MPASTSARNRPVRESVSTPRRFSCQSFVQTLFSVAFALFSVLNFRHFFLLCCEIANYFFLRFPFSLFFPSSLIVCKNYPIRIAFTRPLPSFSLFAYVVRFPQRPSCPKFRLRGLYNLCPFPASPSARKPTCPSLFTEPLLSFYFSLASFAFRKGYPVRNSVSEVFTILIPFLHHHQPENRPVRISVSAPRRFSCQSFVQTLFSIAFALFSVFSLQVLFLFDLTLFFFSRLVLFPLRPCPCSSCLFPQALCMEKFPFPYLYKWIDSIDTLPWQKRCSQTFSLTRLAHIPLFQPVFSLSIGKDTSLRPCFSYAPNFCAPF